MGQRNVKRRPPHRQLQILTILPRNRARQASGLSLRNPVHSRLSASDNQVLRAVSRSAAGKWSFELSIGPFPLLNSTSLQPLPHRRRSAGSLHRRHRCSGIKALPHYQTSFNPDCGVEKEFINRVPQPDGRRERYGEPRSRIRQICQGELAGLSRANGLDDSDKLRTR